MNVFAQPMLRVPFPYAWMLAVVLGGFGARPAHAIDLAQVVDLTLGHDADLMQAQAGYAAAREAKPQARAGLLPQLAGGWGRSYNRIDTPGEPRIGYWQSGWTVSLVQPVFDWSKWTAYQQADYVAARGAVEVDSARQAAILRAARGYFDELAAEDELARSTDYVAAVETHLADTTRRERGGEATVIDLRDADTALQQAQLQALDARDALLAKRRALETTTGAPFEPLARLPDALPLPALDPANPDAWAAQARSGAYPVQRQQLDSEIAKLDAKKIHAEHYPVVAASATYTPAGAAAGYSRPTTTTTAMLTVTIPLYSGGETVARERAALALADKAEDASLAASRDAEAAARDAYARYQFERQRIDALTRLVHTAGQTLDATRIGYRVGSRTSVDVLRAVDTVYATRRDLTKARYDAVVALLELKAQTATLSVDDIAQLGRGMQTVATRAGNGAVEVGRGAPVTDVVTGAVTDVVTAAVTAPVSAAITTAVTPRSATSENSAIAASVAAPVAAASGASMSMPPSRPAPPVAIAARTPPSRYDAPPHRQSAMLPDANLPATGLTDLQPLNPTVLAPL